MKQTPLTTECLKGAYGDKKRDCGDGVCIVSTSHHSWVWVYATAGLGDIRAGHGSIPQLDLVPSQLGMGLYHS